MFGCLRLIRRAVTLITVVILAFTALAAGTVVLNSRKHDTGHTDAIVVLGAAQYAGRPTPLLANRLDHARLVLRQGVAPRIITVGGKRPGDTVTEAQAGVRYLRSRGISAGRLIAVPAGSDTWTSVEAVAAVCKKRGWSSVTIVSDPAHVARAAAMARRLGLRAQVSPTVGGSGTKVTAAYVARESVALMWFWVWRWMPEPVRSRWPA